MLNDWSVLTGRRGWQQHERRPSARRLVQSPGKRKEPEQLLSCLYQKSEPVSSRCSRVLKSTSREQAVGLGQPSVPRACPGAGLGSRSQANAVPRGRGWRHSAARALLAGATVMATLQPCTQCHTSTAGTSSVG